MNELEVALMERDNWAGIVDRIMVMTGAETNKLEVRIQKLLLAEWRLAEINRLLQCPKD